MIKKHRNFLLFLFFSSFLVRALFFMSFTRHNKNAWIYFDSDQYQTVAQHITHGEGISLEPNTPEFYRLPGYPLFLAGIYTMFGEHVQVALWIQLILASFIPMLIFLLSLTLFPAQYLLAKIAGLVACFHLGFVLYAGMLATESLCVFFLLLFFIFFFGALYNFSSAHLFQAGIFLGLASLMRPIGHYLVLLAILMIIYFMKQKIKNSMLFSAGWLLIISPWLIRNFLLTGALFFHTLPGLHFLQYTAAHIVMQRDHIEYPQARRLVLAQWDHMIATKELHKKLNDYERCVLGEKLAFEYIKRYPWYACKYSLIELFKTCAGLYSAVILLADTGKWPDYGSGATWMQKVKRFLFPEVEHSFLKPIIYWEIILFFLMMLGMMFFMYGALYDKQMLQCAFVTFPFIMLLIVLTLAYGGARLRMPCEPLLIICAVAGWLYLLGKKHDASAS